LSVDHAAGGLGRNVTDYQIAVANKQYHEGAVQIRVSGIDPQDIHLSADALTLGKVEHKSLTLSISPHLAHGLYRVQIEVRSRDGWVGRTSIQHLAG
jgi:methionine-rich copper-binding protein CopC